MAKVKIWKRADGGVSVTHFDFSKKPEDLTDDEYIELECSKLRLNPKFFGATESILDSSELPPRDEERDKWRLNPQGKVIKDKSVELPKEAKLRKKNSLKVKLKNSLALTDEDLNLLLGE